MQYHHLGKTGLRLPWLNFGASSLGQEFRWASSLPANPDNVRKWATRAEQPLDRQLLSEVLDILRPIHNWFYIEGQPKNNDP